MLGVLLAFASSLAIGGTDFVAGFKARQLGVLTVVVFSQIAGLAALLAIWLAAGAELPDSGELLLYAVVSSVGQLVAVFAFWHGLTVGSMGVIAPISATGAVIPVVVGLAGGDRPSVPQAVGIACAVVGVMLASYERSDADGGLPIARGVGFALLGALGIGIFYTGLAAAAEHGGALETATLNRVFSCALLLAPALALRRRIAARAADLPALAAVGLLETTGIALFAAAATQGLLAVVGPVAALYPLTTVGLARFVLGERLPAVARVGAVVAVLGLALVAGAADG